MTEPVVAIVPFRKGSKGLPGKNVRHVAGRPLWEWSAYAAFGSDLDSVILTTDYPITPELALGCVAALLVQRPPELATDDAPLDAALVHAIDAASFDGIVVVLQPTVPVRRPGLIDDCVAMFRRFPAAKSLVTVNPLHFVWDGDSGRMLNPPRVNRQAMRDGKLYEEDGSVYVVRASDLRAHRSRVVDPVILFETERTVDIDTESDFRLAEQLLRERHDPA